MKKSRSGPSSPKNMRRMVSGSMTVNVADASIDMFTPPCSPNSWRALASAAAGSSHIGAGMCGFLDTMKSLRSRSSARNFC